MRGKPFSDLQDMAERIMDKDGDIIYQSYVSSNMSPYSLTVAGHAEDLDPYLPQKTVPLYTDNTLYHDGACIMKKWVKYSHLIM